MTGNTVPLYVVCSPCRRVGKTLVSRLLTEFHIVGDRPVAAFDLADEGPQLADYLPELTTIADIGDTRGQIAFFDRLIADNNGAKIIDVSHRTFRNFFAIVQKIGLFEEARRRCIEPLILFIVDPDPKSAKAYAMLRRWFTEASLLPVRNKTEAGGLSDGAALPIASPAPASLDIRLLGFALRALIEQESFSFSKFWRTTSADLPEALDEELRDWVERIFFQCCELELCLSSGETWTGAAASRSRPPGTAPRHRQRDGRPLDARRDPESATDNRRSIGVPEQVLQFAPRKRRGIGGAPMDRSGDAIVAMLQRAGRQLRAAEDRIDKLETEIERFQDRAVRAETWLQLIEKEIEEKLIAPAAAIRSKIDDVSP